MTTTLEFLSNAEMQGLRSKVLMQQGKLEEAENILRDLILKNYQDARSYADLSRICFKTNRFHEANGYIHKALELFPESMDYLYQSVLISHSLSDKNSIDQMIAKMRRIAPDSDQIKILSDIVKEPVENARSVLIGVWGFYEDLIKNNQFFTTSQTALGDNLLRPFNQLYQDGIKRGVFFVSLDLVIDFSKIDAYLFLDFPQINHPLVSKAIRSGKPNILLLQENEAIKPDGWLISNHTYFQNVFTWNDDWVDGRRYKKFYNPIDLPESVEGAGFKNRKLCTLIASAKYIRHSQELYSHRISAIQWFEKEHPDDFDLYGIGWDKNYFPSYQGQVESKKEVLEKYRFAICYENTCEYSGYITEKIFDCFKAGCIPIYWGAPNVETFIPSDCFIDKRQFESYESLFDFISKMSETDYQNYIKGINRFLRSELAEKFTSQYFSSNILEGIRTLLDEEKKAQPLITVVIPTYNHGRFLEQAIQSVFLQEVPEFELFILDNASTDETPNIVKKYLQDSRIKYIRHKENLGIQINFNKALLSGTGKYLTILSADDFFYPGHLKTMIEALEAHPECDLAYCPIMVVNENGKSIGLYQQPGYRQMSYFGGRNEFADLLRFDCYITPSAAVFRRRAVQKTGGFDINYKGASDYDLWIRFAEQNPNFIYLNKYNVAYRRHSDQGTNKLLQTTDPLDDHIKILEKALFSDHIEKLSGYERNIYDWLESRTKWYSPEKIIPFQNRINTIANRIVEIEFLNRKKEIKKIKDIPTVLFILHGFPPKNLYGTELYSYYLAQELSRLGFDIRVLIPTQDAAQAEGVVQIGEYQGIKIYSMNLGVVNDLAKMIYNPVVKSWISELIKRLNVDLVHFHHLLFFTGAALEGAADAGVPVVMTAHDEWLICEQCHMIYPDGTFCQGGPESGEKCAKCLFYRLGQPTSLASQITNLANLFSQRLRINQSIIQYVDSFLVPSQFVRDTLGRFGVSHPNMIVAPLGLVPFEVKPHQTDSANKLRFTVIGTIIHTKGLDIAIEAFNLLNSQNASLNIYGQIPDQKYFDHCIKSVKPGLDVIYHGAYQPQDLPDIMSKSDVAVIPSRSESYSITTRENLHAKVPVIAAGVGGLLEAIQEGINGFLFKPGDAQDLAERMQLFMRDKTLVEKIQKNVDPVVSISDDAHQISRIYRELLEAGKNRNRPAFANHLSAEQKLAAILNSEDIISFLHSHQPWLDQELLLLVNQNQQNAQEMGNADLAEGLLDLAEYISRAIHQ